jgi:hypothetical protein
VSFRSFVFQTNANLLEIIALVQVPGNLIFSNFVSAIDWNPVQCETDRVIVLCHLSKLDHANQKACIIKIYLNSYNISSQLKELLSFLPASEVFLN